MALTHSFLAIVAAIVLVSASSPTLSSATSMVERHREWMSRFGRSYKDAAEESHRFSVFKKNVEYIDSFNQAGNHSYKLAVNIHADLTHDEFMATRTGFRMPSQSIHNTSSSSSFRYAHTSTNEIPANVDWKAKGAVTDIKDQGTCGCCWAFAAVAALEGLNQVRRGNLVSLSEQELVDCESESNGCGGGTFDSAFELVSRNGGLSTEAEYPYQGAQGSCNMDRDSSRVGQITGFEKVPENSESELMKAVAKQPVAVAIDASGDDFRFYSSGVFAGECGTQLNHAVTVVGYGESSEDKYWVVKNSWGMRWGDAGYIKIQRDTGLMGGLCGIAMHASYPTA